MRNSLSIRSYSKQSRTHIHDYHQLVLPTQGSIQIEIPVFKGNVSVGECVVIKTGQRHLFKADEAARFVVADMYTLPSKLELNQQQIFSINGPLQSFLGLVEKQLALQVNPAIETTLMQLFVQLLEQQPMSVPMDSRIRRVLAHIMDHLHTPLTIQVLADTACLSPTQFKKLFKQNLDISPMQYITEQRMEKAKALLSHSDLPVQLVAEQVGYQDLSAFSRRFSKHYGLSPSAFSHD